MANELSVAEKNALAVSYEVMGQEVKLDLDFVKNYLVTGSSKLVTNQEVVFFMNLCKMQKLNPLSREAYLIKYKSDEPAQTVIGKAAYMRRAYENPEYMGKEDGIIVQRGGDIVQKEGTCIYPGETLIGGWCRVRYKRDGEKMSAYKEVSLSEYNRGMANWKSKPATMINKVAISQCVREAFPREYEGLYSEDEMLASGAVPAEFTEVQPTETVVASAPPAMISKEQKQQLVAFLQESFGPKEGAAILKDICGKRGIDSPDKIPEVDFDPIMAELEDKLNEMIRADVEEAQDYVDNGFMDQVDDSALPFA